ncbi:beta-ketoacyl synthase chain length factor [Dactylosporangium sp. NPDC051541]|uniref:beta-ketoacyl synthase chain length factor n=1 Tax=Dactylosporangium sp. NPDC051541 TaxID=3363977 RepID=UPI0037A1286D
MSGLVALATAQWPADAEPPKLAGFVHSDFNPLVAAVAGQCLRQVSTQDEQTALVLVSDLGDIDSAVHVAKAVDDGARVGPLFFFQSVPNAVLGHIAATWGLHGPVSCVCDTAAGLDTARGLLADGDARRVLLIDLSADLASGTLLAERGTS